MFIGYMLLHLFGIYNLCHMLIIIVIIILIYYRPLVIRWQFSGNSRSQQEIKASYPSNLRIIIIITFMQGIYNYMPETNHVYSTYTVAAVLYLQFVLHVIIIIIIIIITFMQGIYNYMPETNHVYRTYTVAAVLYLQFVLHVIIIIIIIIIIITFMQGIYNYMPETNHVYSTYTVAAVLYLQFVLHVYYYYCYYLTSCMTLAHRKCLNIQWFRVINSSP